MPQGSILGPLLFILYVDSLPSYLSSSTTALLFADDTKLSNKISSFSDCSVLQKDLISLSQWSRDSGLSFNAGKCTVVRFCTNSSPFVVDYLLDSYPLKVSKTCRDLGVIISDNLSWSEHYKSISSKAYGQLSLIRRCFATSSISAKKLLYLSLIRSKVTYCSQVWRPMLIQDIVRLERIQRRATKYITSDFNKLSYKERLVSLKLLPLMYYYELCDVLFFVKCIKCPDSSFNVLQFVNFVSSNTRSGSNKKLILPLSSSNRFRHSYFPRLVRLWNKLPCIDLDKSFPVIKSNLIKFFWDHFLVNFNSDNVCSFHFLCPCSSCHFSVSAPSSFI